VNKNELRARGEQSRDHEALRVRRKLSRISNPGYLIRVVSELREAGVECGYDDAAGYITLSPAIAHDILKRLKL